MVKRLKSPEEQNTRLKKLVAGPILARIPDWINASVDLSQIQSALSGLKLGVWIDVTRSVVALSTSTNPYFKD